MMQSVLKQDLAHTDDYLLCPRTGEPNNKAGGGSGIPHGHGASAGHLNLRHYSHQTLTRETRLSYYNSPSKYIHRVECSPTRSFMVSYKMKESNQQLFESPDVDNFSLSNDATAMDKRGSEISPQKTRCTYHGGGPKQRSNRFHGGSDGAETPSSWYGEHVVLQEEDCHYLKQQQYQHEVLEQNSTTLSNNSVQKPLRASSSHETTINSFSTMVSSPEHDNRAVTTPSRFLCGTLTYRDYSNVPPTDEDRERYDKKNRHRRSTNDQERHGDAPKNDPIDKILKKRGRGNRAASPDSSPNKSFIGFMGTNFPARLHDLLTLSLDEGNDSEGDISSVISWLPHGRSWVVHDKVQFLKKVAPSHFQITKYESFLRQVNGWGFKRVTREGADFNSYYHEMFLKGMPHLVRLMKRRNKKCVRIAPTTNKCREEIIEPNFQDFAKKHPIPDYYGSNETTKKREQEVKPEPDLTRSPFSQREVASPCSKRARASPSPSSAEEKESTTLISDPPNEFSPVICKSFNSMMSDSSSSSSALAVQDNDDTIASPYPNSSSPTRPPRRDLITNSVIEVRNSWIYERDYHYRSASTSTSSGSVVSFSHQHEDGDRQHHSTNHHLSSHNEYGEDEEAFSTLTRSTSSSSHIGTFSCKAAKRHYAEGRNEDNKEKEEQGYLLSPPRPAVEEYKKMYEKVFGESPSPHVVLSPSMADSDEDLLSHDDMALASCDLGVFDGNDDDLDWFFSCL